LSFDYLPLTPKGELFRFSSVCFFTLAPKGKWFVNLWLSSLVLQRENLLKMVKVFAIINIYAKFVDNKQHLYE